MAENTKIGWTDHTLNPWIGCTRVGPGCDHCYAEAFDKRGMSGTTHWGAGVARRRTSEANWNLARKWDRQARLSGKRPWVFCASMADVFDNEVPVEWREDLWALIRETPHINWQLLTKRIGNVLKMLPADFPAGFGHVGIMATTVTQEEIDRDVPKLLKVKEAGAAWVGLSIEPLIEPVTLRGFLPMVHQHPDNRIVTPEAKAAMAAVVRRAAAKLGPQLDWVIIGGESGHGARPFEIGWAKALIEECRPVGLPVFMKQLGENWKSDHRLRPDSQPYPPIIGSKKGDNPNEWPEYIRFQEMPHVSA